MRRELFCFFLACGLLRPVSLPAADPEIRLADGARLQGVLVAADAQWQWTFRTSAGPRGLAAADLCAYGRPAEPAGKPLVLLPDGGLLAGEVLAADRQQLRLDSDLFGEVSLPISLVTAIVPRSTADPRQCDALCDRLGSLADNGRLLLANGDELRGTLGGWKDGQIDWQGDLGPLRTAVRQVTAVALATRTKTPPPTALQAWVGLRDGSRLLARAMELKQGRLQIKLQGGPTLTCSEPDSVVWLEPRQGRMVYLSDLAPAEYRHVPYLSLMRSYGVDRSAGGSRLRCQGRSYLKGLGVYSTARLTYLLAEPYRRFEAELAIDDLAAGGGSVRFRVFVDGQPKYQSEVVRGGQAPVSVALDIAGAKRLDLVVDFAQRADQCDYADWLAARLVK